MRTSIENLLGIDNNQPLHRLAGDLVAADAKMLDDLVAIRRRTLSQAEVAARMGISQGAVARIEAGDRNPHLSTLRRYAHAVRARVEHAVVPLAMDRTPNVRPWTNTFDKPAPHKAISEAAPR